MTEATGGAALADWCLPEFTMEERERRWSRVRSLMRRDGIDCIIGLNNTGSMDRNQADVRYLTQLANNSDETAVCFPIEGKVTVFTNSGGLWPAGNWIGETVRSRRQWSTCLTQALREARMERATIAVCGLTPSAYSVVRQPDGYVGHTAMKRMKEALPDARFVSASDLMGEARLVKSPEEIAFLRRAADIAEKTFLAMLNTSRVGVFEPLLLANMHQVAIAAGGNLPFMTGWTSGPFGHAFHRMEQPAHRYVKSGDYLTVEIEGRWAGYTAQIDRSITFGEVPDWAPDAHRAAVECFWDILGVMKAGVTYGELVQAARKVNKNPKVTGELIIHGRGLGDDGPLITNQSQPTVMDRPLVESSVFIVKPSVTYNGLSDVAHVGDPVIVTATGVERLGTHPIEHYWHVD